MHKNTTTLGVVFTGIAVLILLFIICEPAQAAPPDAPALEWRMIERKAQLDRIENGVEATRKQCRTQQRENNRNLVLDLDKPVLPPPVDFSILED